MEPKPLFCHACNAPVVVEVRVGRRDLCDACGADLHACLNCRHHDPRAHNECREPGTEPVRDRSAGNFCDHFEFRTGQRGATESASAARSKLEALFGGSTNPDGERARALFDDVEDPAAAAKKRLEDLFKK